MYFQAAKGLNWNDRGNVINPDYNIEDFTKNGQWCDLDISAIVGTGKKLVFLRLSLINDTAGTQVRFRSKDITTELNIESAYTQANAVRLEKYLWIYTDSNGIIQYNFWAIGWTLASLYVRGWFK